MDAQSDTSRTPNRGQLPLPESESRMCSSRQSAEAPRLARVTIDLWHYVYLKNLHCLVISRCTCSIVSEIRDTHWIYLFQLPRAVDPMRYARGEWEPCGMSHS